MAYALRSEASAVHVAKSVHGVYRCNGCTLSHYDDTVSYTKSTAMLAHLMLHRVFGDKVPERAIIRLQEDYANTNPRGD